MKQLIRLSDWRVPRAFAAACASVGGGGGGTDTSGGAGRMRSRLRPPSISGRVKTSEHVDLWLHGYALLQEDTTFVPFFRRGYGTDMIVLKNRANVVTQLDANRDRLRARLAANPQLINAQFVPLSFSNWAELTRGRRSVHSRERRSARGVIAAAGRRDRFSRRLLPDRTPTAIGFACSSSR